MNALERGLERRVTVLDYNEERPLRLSAGAADHKSPVEDIRRISLTDLKVSSLVSQWLAREKFSKVIP